MDIGTVAQLVTAAVVAIFGAAKAVMSLIDYFKKEKP